MKGAALKCPGLYCGRTLLSNGSYTDCGACPTGYRSSSSYITSSAVFSSSLDSSECIPCSEPLSFYDWLYLLFVTIVLLIVEWYIIDYSLKRRNLPFEVLTLHLSATIEVMVSALSTLLLVSDPWGNFSLRSCRVSRLSDWYTLFFNPSPGYEATLRCTQEAVYPLYSMVFLFYALSLGLLLLVRPFIVCRSSDKKAIKTVYLTMYMIPALVLIQATFGGLIYYSFPYVTIIGSCVSIAAHLAFRLDQRISALFIHSFKDARSVVILLGHWLLHAFGILALTEIKSPVIHGILLASIPFPTLFYILTSQFSDPSKLHFE